MNTEAIVTLIIGATVLWGGLAFFLWNAWRSSKKKQKTESF